MKLLDIQTGFLGVLQENDYRISVWECSDESMEIRAVVKSQWEFYRELHWVSIDKWTILPDYNEKRRR